jgi:hypothetical protein
MHLYTERHIVETHKKENIQEEKERSTKKKRSSQNTSHNQTGFPFVSCDPTQSTYHIYKLHHLQTQNTTFLHDKESTDENCQDAETNISVDITCSTLGYSLHFHLHGYTALVSGSARV